MFNRKLFTTLALTMVLSVTATGCAATSVGAETNTETPTAAAAEETAAKPDLEALTEDDIKAFIVFPEGKDPNETEDEDKTEAKPEAKDEAKEEETEEDTITGFRTVYVLEGTKEFDPSMAVWYDETVITGVTADDTEVDYSKAGSYKVTYEAAVIREAYTAFLEDPEGHIFHFVPAYVDPEEAVKEPIETMEADDPDEPDYTPAEPAEDDVIVKVEGQVVVVVTEKEAEVKAKEFVPVYTDKGALVDETVAEAMPTPEAMAEKAVETVASEPAQAQTQAATAVPAAEHTHNWVQEQVVTKAAWDEQIKVKDGWDETVKVRDAYDETVVVKAAWDEQVVTKAAWDETVVTQAAWDETVDNVSYEVRTVCDCGADISGWSSAAVTAHQEACGSFGWSSRQIEISNPQTIHHDAETTVVHHDAEYSTVHHDAETKVVHHDAEYKNVHHDAEYNTVHHDAEYGTVTKCSICGATR